MGNQCYQGLHGDTWRRNILMSSGLVSSFEHVHKIEPSDPVFFLHNFPNDTLHKFTASQTTRFGSVEARRIGISNQSRADDILYYDFSMPIQDSEVAQVKLPVLTDMSHQAIHEMSQFVVEPYVVTDPFSPVIKDSLVDAVQKRSLKAYSLKIISFKGYNSYEFKAGLHELWIYQKMAARGVKSIIKLEHAYVNGIDEKEQILVLVFERVKESLLRMAQVRLATKWPWSKDQVIHILLRVSSALKELKQNLSIVHRNIRPTTVYLTEAGEYKVGGFGYSRVLRQNKHQDDELTVIGVPAYSTFQVKAALSVGDAIARYIPTHQDCKGFLSLIRLMMSLDIQFSRTDFADADMTRITDVLVKSQNIDQVFQQIRRLPLESDDLSEDPIYGSKVRIMLAQKDSSLISDLHLTACAAVSSYLDFSEVAHVLIEANKKKGNNLQNAKIFKRLAYFYQSKGVSGTEYYFHAYTILIKEIQKNTKYGKLTIAQQLCEDAEYCHTGFNSSLSQVNHYAKLLEIQALLELEEGKIDGAQKKIDIIKQLVGKSTESSIPIRQQISILLTQSQILRAVPTQSNMDISSQHIYMAKSAAQSAASSMKEDQINEINARINIQECLYLLKSELAVDRSIDKQKSNKLIQSALDCSIKASESLNKIIYQVIDLGIAENLIAEALMRQEKWALSREHNKKALVLIRSLGSQVSRQKIFEPMYREASINFREGNFAAAREGYQATINMLGINSGDRFLMATLKGNSGLCLIYQGKEAGHSIVFQSLSILEQHPKKKDHYDYQFLHNEFIKAIESSTRRKLNAGAKP